MYINSLDRQPEKKRQIIASVPANSAPVPMPTKAEAKMAREESKGNPDRSSAAASAAANRQKKKKEKKPKQ